jgi:hypothetical protein
MDYTKGYCKGGKLSPEHTAHEFERMKSFLSHHQNQLQRKANVRLFELKPQIKDTFDNYIEDTHGNLSIPGIIEKIKSIHQADVSDDANWYDDQLLKYVNDQNIEAKKKHPDTENDNVNLGKLPHFDDKDIDPSNSDALVSLTPAVIKD